MLVQQRITPIGDAARAAQAFFDEVFSNRNHLLSSHVMRFSVGIGVAIVLCAAMILACDIGVRPASWSAVKTGDLRATLEAKFPGIHIDRTPGHQEDELVEPRLTGYWLSYFAFSEEDRVAYHYQSYCLGTKRYHIVLRSIAELVKSRR